MGLKYRPMTLFNPEWVKAVKGAPESAMAATIVIYDPNISSDVYDAETDTWETNVRTVVYTGKARIQPLRSENTKDQPGNATSVQAVLISVPISAVDTEFRVGYQADVLTAPLNPSLLLNQFVLTGPVDSSNPIERTFMFTVNQETING